MSLHRTIGMIALPLLGLLPGFEGVRAQDQSAGQDQPVEWTAEIRFAGETEPVLRYGERARLYYSTNRDAYVAIVHIDTDGDARLVFPRAPNDVNYVSGGQEHRLLFRRTSTFRVQEDPGIGYFFVLASPEPLLLSRLDYSHEVQDWDLREVGQRVFTDPYEAMDRWVELLIPDWEYVPYALGVATYHVEERHEYPRFMCYGCHVDDAGPVPYREWNPYLDACLNFQVVSYTEPVYYPVVRYGVSNVVFVNPVWQGPRWGFERRHDRETEPRPIVANRTTRPPADRRVAPVRRPDGNGLGTAVDRERARTARVPTVRGTPDRPQIERRSEPARRRVVDLGVISGTARSSTARPSTEPERRPTTSSGAGSTGRAGVPVRVAPTRRSSGSAVRGGGSPTTVRAPSGAVRAGGSAGPVTVRRPSGAVTRRGGGAVRSGTGTSRGAVRAPAGTPTRTMRVLTGSRTSGSVRSAPATRARGSGVVRRPTSSGRPSVVRRPTRSGGTVRSSTPARKSGGTVKRPASSGSSRSGGAVRARRSGGGSDGGG